MQFKKSGSCVCKADWCGGYNINKKGIADRGLRYRIYMYKSVCWLQAWCCFAGEQWFVGTAIGPREEQVEQQDNNTHRGAFRCQVGMV